jgi:hypothetical protein
MKAPRRNVYSTTRSNIPEELNLKLSIRLNGLNQKTAVFWVVLLTNVLKFATFSKDLLPWVLSVYVFDALVIRKFQTAF